jgi:hypothetical protein
MEILSRALSLSQPRLVLYIAAWIVSFSGMISTQNMDCRAVLKGHHYTMNLEMNTHAVLC